MKERENFDWADIIANKRPVMLRNGIKAYIVADLRDYPETEVFNLSEYKIRGFAVDDDDEHSWRVDGCYHNMNDESEHDIIGLWKETINVSIPRPLKELREKCGILQVTGMFWLVVAKIITITKDLKQGFILQQKRKRKSF